MTDLERLQLQRDTVARIHASQANRARMPKPLPLEPRRKPIPPATTIARVAARYAHLWRITVTAAAREFCCPRSSAHDAWRRMYPGVSAVLSLRDEVVR